MLAEASKFLGEKRMLPEGRVRVATRVYSTRPSKSAGKPLWAYAKLSGRGCVWIAFSALALNGGLTVKISLSNSWPTPGRSTPVAVSWR